jgi:type IV secretory pathway protease TraF
VLPEAYIGKRRTSAPHSQQMAPIVATEGHWLIVGVHRDDPHDSRFRGPLPTDQVVGNVLDVVGG